MVVEAEAQLELVMVRQSDQVVSALHVLPESDFLRQLHDVHKSLGGVWTVALQDELLEPVDRQHAVSHVFGFVVANHLEVFLQRLVVDVEVLDSVTDDSLSVRIKKMFVSKSAQLNDGVEFFNFVQVCVFSCVRSQLDLQIYEDKFVTSRTT